MDSDSHNYNTLHAAGENTSKGRGLATNISVGNIVLPLEFDESAGRSFGYDPDPGDWTYPRHAVVPAMVYIGGRRVSQSGKTKYGVTVTDVSGV